MIQLHSDSNWRTSPSDAEFLLEKAQASQGRESTTWLPLCILIYSVHTTMKMYTRVMAEGKRIQITDCWLNLN